MVLDAVLQLVIVAAAGAGLSVATYVWRHKKTQQAPMVCPMHANCETVVHSQFSKFFGIPVEWLGIAYYGLILAAYLVLFWQPEARGAFMSYALLTLSTGAFLFSVYLTFIQIFNLREYCSWCLLSAALSTIIFLASFMGLWQAIVPWLGEHKTVFVVWHLIGVSLGVGGAMISDYLFFRFLQDWKISLEESEILGMLSQVIWLALAFLVISGLALYLPQMEELNQSGKFLAKMIMVGVIIVNGAILNLVISPKLIDMFAGKGQGNRSKTRKLAFALGAISMTSWLSVLVVATALPRSFSGPKILITYAVFLLGAVVVSQFIERKVSGAMKTPSPADAGTPPS